MTERWHCTCGNTPCDGLDCGVWLHAPRKQPAPKTPEQKTAIRARAWETRRAMKERNRDEYQG